MLKKLSIAAGGMLAFGFFSFGLYANPIAKVGAGYKAKILCSEIFLAGRDAADVEANEFDGIDPIFDRITAKVDKQNKSVTTSIFGLGRNRAIFRDGYGCTIVPKGEAVELPELNHVANTPWPEASVVSKQAIARVDYAKIDEVLGRAFGNEQKNTDYTAANRAFLIAVDGKIIAERYADGFSKETPFLSWSMAKSITATLVGAAVLQGYIDVNNLAPAPEWEGDPARSEITWNDLLRMQSGLAFEEVYEDPKSDANQMLFASRDTSAVAANRPRIHPAGEHWSYSSGTTNLISKLLRQTLELHDVNYHSFARNTLLDPIGAASATMEPDASGTFVGSSFIYATARDWARLGQLYLQDGVWDGERLLPEDWSEYVRSATPASNGQYGAHFWLNLPGENGRAKWIEGLPDDVYIMAGHEGQYVFIIPSKNTVIVRLGITRGAEPIAVTGPVITELYNAIGDLQD